jgi:hypothetical protein
VNEEPRAFLTRLDSDLRPAVRLEIEHHCLKADCRCRRARPAR